MNKKRCLFLIAVALIVLSPSLLYSFGSEEVSQPAYEEFPEALGFQYGEISGGGLSYQIWREALGFQVAGGIIYIPLEGEAWDDRTLDYLVGAEIQVRVYGEDFASWLSGQLYGFAGVNHGGYIPVITVKEAIAISEEEWLPPEYATGSFTPTFGVGLGIGIEIIVFRHFSIPIELGYGLQWIPTAETLPEQFSVNLYPQIGFRYRF